MRQGSLSQHIVLRAAITPAITTLVCQHRTDWAKVSTDEDSMDLPADTTESVLHGALTSMRRSAANSQPSGGSGQDSYSPSDAEKGQLRMLLALRPAGGDTRACVRSKCAHDAQFSPQ